MKALRYYGRHDMRIEQMPDPVPGPGEARIRIAAAGICGTDLEIYDGLRRKGGSRPSRPGSFELHPPAILGHENAGYVDAVGPGVTNVREGDFVAIEPHLYCGECRYCRTGREHLCVLTRAWGVDFDGGMAEFMLVPARIAYTLPSSVSPAVGALTESMGCVVHGMDQLAPLSGLPLAIFGAGITALMNLALARLSGLNPIVVVEPDAARRRTAEAFGATATVDPSQPDWAEQCRAVVGPEGFDYIIQTVDSCRVLESAMTVAANGARILIFARFPPDETAAINLMDMYKGELSIVSAVINPYVTHRTVELLPVLGLDRADIKAFPLEAFPDAFEARRGHAAHKIQFSPQP